MISRELNTFCMIPKPEVPVQTGSTGSNRKYWFKPEVLEKTSDKDTCFKVDTNDGDFMANAATKSETLVGESDGSSSGSDSSKSTSSLSVDVSMEGSVSTPQGSGGGGASLGVRNFFIVILYIISV